MNLPHTSPRPALRPVILVVDDTPQHLSLMSDVLAGLYAVKLAPSGARALKIAIGPTPPDLILLDIDMPDMDGFEVIRQLKANPATQRIPVVFLTALEDAATEERGLDLGAVDYITKPINPPVVLARVRNHIALRRQADEMAAWNRSLTQRVEESLAERERLGRLRRFFSPAVANLLIAGEDEDLLRARRREIVVVFLDLRGYTEFTEQHDADEVMRVLGEYHAAMGELIIAHGGTLERFTGDGMMIFFNDPVEIDNPALEALRMTIGMCARIEILQHQWQQRGYNLTMGIGIAQGIATIGAIGFEGRRDYGAIGGVTNLAARLCGKANGGQILVCGSVVRNAGPGVRFRSIGKLALKGYAQPQEAFEVAPERDIVETLAVAPDAQGLQQAGEWVGVLCRDNNVPREQAERLAGGLNEVFGNITARDAAGSPAAPVQIQLDLRRDAAGDEVSLTVTDSGPPLDPLLAVGETLPAGPAAAVAPDPARQALRSSSDRLAYRRSDAHNHFEITERWSRTAPSSAIRPPPLLRRSPDRRNPADTGASSEVRNLERRRDNYNWIALFRSVDAAALARIVGDSEVLAVRAGTPLLKMQENNQSVYILLSGSAVVQFNTSPDTTSTITITPGECVGELSAIDGKLVCAVVIAVTDIRVLKLTRDVFWNRLLTLPGVASNLIYTLVARMRTSNEQTMSAQRNNLELTHLRKELELARSHQLSMLPLQRPLFPDRPEVAVCTFMEPAEKVGGSLFDAFFVDARHLFFCIGDIAAQGIAAALFMARTIALLRLPAMTQLAPHALLAALSERLRDEQETGNVLTLFCGLLDVATGRLSYANGGHCAPILLAGGRAEPLPLPPGHVVGSSSSAAASNYGLLERQLAPGDVLLCYTEGLVEARNAAGVSFAASRCPEIITRTGNGDLCAMLDNIRSELENFIGTNPLEDDCALLALRYRG